MSPRQRCTSTGGASARPPPGAAVSTDTGHRLTRRRKAERSGKAGADEAMRRPGVGQARRVTRGGGPCRVARRPDSRGLKSGRGRCHGRNSGDSRPPAPPAAPAGLRPEPTDSWTRSAADAAVRPSSAVWASHDSWRAPTRTKLRGRGVVPGALGRIPRCPDAGGGRGCAGRPCRKARRVNHSAVVARRAGCGGSPLLPARHGCRSRPGCTWAGAQAAAADGGGGPTRSRGSDRPFAGSKAAMAASESQRVGQAVERLPRVGRRVTIEAGSPSAPAPAGGQP